MIFTAKQKWEAVVRELKLRTTVYPNRVLTKRMSAKQAAYQIEIMAAIVEDYRILAEQEQLL